MKGLAIALGQKPKGPVEEDSEKSKESASGGSEKEYARLASEAIADGDHDAAADALVSLVKACSRSYGKE